MLAAQVVAVRRARQQAGSKALQAAQAASGTLSERDIEMLRHSYTLMAAGACEGVVPEEKILGTKWMWCVGRSRERLIAGVRGWGRGRRGIKCKRGRGVGLVRRVKQVVVSTGVVGYAGGQGFAKRVSC